MHNVPVPLVYPLSAKIRPDFPARLMRIHRHKSVLRMHASPNTISMQLSAHVCFAYMLVAMRLRGSGGGRTFEAAEMSLTFVKFIASTDSGKRRKVTTPRELYSKYTRMHCVATLTHLKKVFRVAIASSFALKIHRKVACRVDSVSE